MTETHSEKCYITVCHCCGVMYESERKDRLTCSDACRVKAHRNGSLETLRGMAAKVDLNPALLLQCEAITRLGLGHLIDRGLMKVDGDARVAQAFNRYVLEAAKSINAMEGVNHAL